MITFLAGFVVALGLLLAWQRYAGFAAQKPDDYAGVAAFDIRKVLDGDLSCQGVIYGPLSRVVSRFDADFRADWEGNRGVMTERFRYDSGDTQDRRWELALSNDGSIAATAPDVVGTGRGVQHGSAMHLRYKIMIERGKRSIALDVVDWMYLTPDGTIMNRSQFRKFGIKVAELVATLRPKE